MEAENSRLSRIQVRKLSFNILGKLSSFIFLIIACLIFGFSIVQPEHFFQVIRIPFWFFANYEFSLIFSCGLYFFLYFRNPVSAFAWFLFFDSTWELTAIPFQFNLLSFALLLFSSGLLLQLKSKINYAEVLVSWSLLTFACMLVRPFEIYPMLIWIVVIGAIANWKIGSSIL